LKPVRRTLALVLSAAVLGLLGALPASAGQAGFSFLEVPAGARAAALGGAYTSLARGAEAAFWNPAGLASFDGTELAATHTETYEHLRQEHFAVAGRMWGGGLAASLRALYSEPIPERDDLGNLVGTFGSHDLEFLAAYGWQPREHLGLGLSAQVVRERIADLGATTWAVNAGAAWDLGFLPGGRASLGVHNLGPAAHYMFGDARGEAVPLPAAVQGGVSLAAHTFQELTARLALEARATRGRAIIYAVGGELDAPAGAALRFGLRAGDDVATWSTGAGWRARSLSVDYAFVPSRLELDDTHRFSLTTRF